MNYITEDYSRIHQKWDNPDKRGWFVAHSDMDKITKLHSGSDIPGYYHFFWWDGRVWRDGENGGEAFYAAMYWFGLAADPDAT